MTFANFSQALEQLEQTPSRLAMTEQLAKLYKQLDKAEIEPAIYLMQGRLVPEYQSLEFNLSTKMIQRGLAKLISLKSATRNKSLTGSEPANKSLAGSPSQTNLFEQEDLSHILAQVNLKYKQLGDLGLVAAEIINDINALPKTLHTKLFTKPLTQPFTQPALSIIQVFTQLKQIAQDDGAGSQERKMMGYVELLKNSDPLTAKYISRIIMGKLRLGFSTMTLIDALSWAVNADKSDHEQLEEAYNKQADVGNLVKTFLFAKNSAERASVLANYTVKNGVPIVPTLAQRLDTFAQVIDKMGEVFAEPKYDGLRIQIHYHHAKPVQAFTRNLEEVSAMMPELEQLSSWLKCKSCILDGEAIGYDPKTQQLVDFQVTITRRRKHDILQTAHQVPLRFYLFDVLEIDNQPLIDQLLIKRRELLQALLERKNKHQTAQTFQLPPVLKTADSTQLKEFHQQQLDQGLEGAIFKKVTGLYRGGRKGWRWVKMKEAEGETGKLKDTIDCIVMGYYLGKGKRTNFGLGAVLVGVLDEKTQIIKTISKIGTGLTEDMLTMMKKRAVEYLTPTKPINYEVVKDLKPDHWMKPGLIIEVAADEITQSPRHSAGVALRFPRLVKFRDDKNWQTATGLVELKILGFK